MVRLKRVRRGVQRAGAANGATDFRAVKRFIDDLANGASATAALSAASKATVDMAGRAPRR